MLAVELKRASQLLYRSVVVAEPVQHVADASNRLRHLGRLLGRDLEEMARLLEQPALLAERGLAEQRTANLEHQVDVVGIAQLQRAMEAAERGVRLAEL